MVCGSVGSASGGARAFGGCRVLLAAAKGGAARSSAKTVAAKRPPSKSSSPPRSSKDASEPKRQIGITKPLPVSPALSEFMGLPEVSRSNAVKKIWEYIKLHNLQTPTDKRVIQCDEKLKTIFDGKDKVGMMEIAKLLSPHFVKTD